MTKVDTRGRPRWKLAVLSACLVPSLLWAQVAPVFAVFGQAYDDGRETIGVPLTCANASTAIKQLNSGHAPGMQASGGWEAPYPPDAGLPDWDLQMMGDSAQKVPATDTVLWAPPPADSQWVYMAWDNDPNPPLLVAYPVAIYIPTAADAARMNVTLQYRAQSQLIGIYRNEIGSANLLSAPITTDTASVGSTAGSVPLNAGWRQGANYLTFVVKGVQTDERVYTGFAARFSAECPPPPTPTAVPTLDSTGLAALALSLFGLGVWAQRRRRTERR